MQVGKLKERTSQRFDEEEEEVEEEKKLLYMKMIVLFL